MMVDSMDLLASLNEQQREAVTTTEGPVLVLAGAGSGKTRVIAHRIAYLIAERGIPPANILAVTFTNKAAEEMRERVESLLRGSKLASAPLISTFHSLCVRILRRDIEALGEGYTRDFTIYDQDDSIRLVKNCLKELGYDEQRLSARSIQSAISHAKNSGLDAEMFAARVEYNDERRAAIARVFRLYDERLRANNALDFDDLLIKTVQLLRRCADIRQHYNAKFRYILVDEYQDTNALQFALVQLLTEQQQNLCVVGDEDQSIYKWRGADITNILNFEKHYKDARIIRLEQNYRSTQNILDAASHVVSHNTERKGKRLWTANPTGEKIRYYQAPDAEMEARFVAATIQEHLVNDPRARIAVLYRTNAQSRLFEEALRRLGIPYQIVGGFSFYERAEVRDIIAYLKLALNPHDSLALQRIMNTPPRGIGRQTVDEIERRARDCGGSYWEAISIMTEQGDGRARAIAALKGFQQTITRLVTLAQRAPASEVVKAAIIDTGYELALKAEGTEEADARLANLQELVNAAVEYDAREGGGLREFLDAAALISDADQYRHDARVTLMTMHAAKGLEFPIVFIVGLEDGIFPHARAAADRAELEEERRLCYVAITRAQRILYLTHAMKRRVYGEELSAEPSQFLSELPLELIEDLSRGRSWLSLKRASIALEDRYAPRRYQGKTYDSVDSIAEFFRRRNARTDQTDRAAAVASQPGEFKPGTHVRHPKYGRGLVIKREGTGDSAKIIVNFPGYGQKKLIEKYANLEPA
jgi:DNA helicase-2/ATP-dependent DNA helicase PcrA